MCMRMRMAVLVCMIVRMTGSAISDRDRLGGRQDEPTGLDSLGADQVVGQAADLARRAAEQDHFEAAVFVEMDMGRRDDAVQVVMLQVGQSTRDPGRRGGRRSG